MRRAMAVLLAAGCVAAAGCAKTDPATEGCANGSQQACEQVKRNEQIDQEAHEVESVIKKRQAEETASAVEGR